MLPRELLFLIASFAYPYALVQLRALYRVAHCVPTFFTCSIHNALLDAVDAYELAWLHEYYVITLHDVCPQRPYPLFDDGIYCVSHTHAVWHAMCHDEVEKLDWYRAHWPTLTLKQYGIDRALILSLMACNRLVALRWIYANYSVLDNDPLDLTKSDFLKTLSEFQHVCRPVLEWILSQWPSLAAKYVANNITV